MNRAFVLLFPVLLLGVGCASVEAPATIPSAAPPGGSSSAVMQTGERFLVSDIFFELPAGWKRLSSEKQERNGGTITKIQVAEEPYRVDLVLYLDPMDTSKRQLGSSLATTPYVTFYNEGCGGCWFSTIMDFSDNAEMSDYVATLTIEGDEPPPPNLDGPWMPRSTASKEQVMEMLKTARPIPR